MRRISPQADPTAHLPGVHPCRVPRHIAIIMDGNGRWAESRGFPRLFGHRNGAAAVRRTIGEAGRLGVEVLTLYSFSIENWTRPAEEVRALMSLYLQYMEGERDELVRHNIRLRQIGRRDGLPPEALAALDRTLEATARCTGPTLCLAVNYGSRAELADAARAIARAARDGTLDPDAIDERTISDHLTTAGLPDPDLLIRTAGEMRVSNFLLWQISYAELFVTDVLWPDFAEEHLREGVRAYAARRRRFGGLDGAPGA
ncbi:MAG TPA: hypothetical protein DEB06_09155 [Phycisphaerales bacterium]|nr:hypothetical protein [Phycisphaerales bacterium]